MHGESKTAYLYLNYFDIINNICYVRFYDENQCQHVKIAIN